MSTASDSGLLRVARWSPRELDRDGVRRLARGLMLLFWFTLPWEAAIRIGGTASLARGIGALFAIGGLAALAVGGRRRRPAELTGLVLAMTVLVVASLWWTLTPAATQARAVTMVQLLVMVALTWEFTDDERTVLALMKAWLAGCVVVALIAGSALASGINQVRYTAPGSSPGDVAYALLIGIPLAWYLALRTTGPVMVWVYRLFVPLACVSILLTASRAGLITLVVALLVVPLTFGWLTSRAWSGVVAGVVVIAAAAVPLSQSLAAPLARLSTTGTELTSGTLDQRTTIWGIGLGIMRDHPVLGTGAGGARDLVSGQFFTGRGLHNTFLSAAAELGVLGLALVLLLLVAAFYPALTRLARLETRVVWVLLGVFVLSLSTRHADYEKSTYALLTLFALMGTWLPRRGGGYRGPAPDSTEEASELPAGSAS
ncbi:hypothetical protein GCM10011519_22920 [Marmoricola endophyticus]|uniref:O-antigen ligase-related domain-containing protein n=1 Tax=Marmoricola endophyticus TaxID=2040280 RepID=A0A917BLM3_9ACTN|nr:O-antigen ligase family protein [Marmoricola endophyticus]GGF48337.1 hypothetical protein GCM10011519_22920 [Marmoricola endophyticus]